MNFLKKKASTLFVTDSPRNDPKFDDLKSRFEEHDRANGEVEEESIQVKNEKIDAKGVVVQVERAMSTQFGGSTKDFFHILVKVEKPNDCTDSNGYQVIRNDNRLPEIPLAKAGDRVTFAYFPNQNEQVLSFTIDFAARQGGAE